MENACLVPKISLWRIQSCIRILSSHPTILLEPSALFWVRWVAVGEVGGGTVSLRSLTRRLLADSDRMVRIAILVAARITNAATGTQPGLQA